MTSSAVLAGDHVEIRLYDFESNNIGKTNESTVNVEEVFNSYSTEFKEELFLPLSDDR